VDDNGLDFYRELNASIEIPRGFELTVRVKAAEDCRISPKRKATARRPPEICASFWSAPVLWRFEKDE